MDTRKIWLREIANEVCWRPISTYFSPPRQMVFDIGAIAHVVLNDGSVALVQSKDNSEREVRSIPITLEVSCKLSICWYQASQYHLNDDTSVRDKKVLGQILAQLFGSILDRAISGNAGEVIQSSIFDNFRGMFFTFKTPRCMYIVACFLRSIWSNYSQAIRWQKRLR